jgi:hypothetical protein
VCWRRYSCWRSFRSSPLQLLRGRVPPGLSVSSPPIIDEPDRGMSKVVFTVKLSRPPRKAVRVRVETVGFTATQGADYVPLRQKLVFRRGERAKRVAVLIVADTVAEAEEEFFVKLSHPRNARLAVSEGIGRIAASDLPAPFSIEPT